MMRRLRKLLLTSFLVMQSLQISLAADKQSELAVNKVKGVLSVLVLGSGGAIATAKGRATSGYLIFTDGKPRILMDVGGGTFARIAESGVNLNKIDTILLSHLHIDHTADMSAVIKTIFLHNLAAKTKRSASKSPIHFYGPGKLPNAAAYDNTSTYIDRHYNPQQGTERYLYGFAKAINAGQFAYKVTDIPADHFNTLAGVTKPVAIQTIIHTDDGLIVKAVGVFHGSVPSIAYRIEYKGKSIVYSGDTTSKTNNLIAIAKDANILIYDTAITDDLPPQGSVFRKFHTAPSRIGEIAKQAKVKILVLSHISPVTEVRLDEVIKSVIKKGYHGKLIVAKDLAVYNVQE